MLLVQQASGVCVRRLMSRLTDPAPVMPSMPPRRNRGVRCSRFVAESSSSNYHDDQYPKSQQRRVCGTAPKSNAMITGALGSCHEINGRHNKREWRECGEKNQTHGRQAGWRKSQRQHPASYSAEHEKEWNIRRTLDAGSTHPHAQSDVGSRANQQCQDSENEKPCHARAPPPNDPIATAATRCGDCNHDGPPPVAAAHGWTMSSYSLLTDEKQNPTITMTAPDAPFDSPEKRNKQPAVTKEHQDPEYPQERALHDVRLWLAKQANRTDANCDAKAADQNVHHRPSLNRAPIEATQRTVTRAMMHSWSNANIGYPQLFTGAEPSPRKPRRWPR
jgi:hypothetical protein